MLQFSVLQLLACVGGSHVEQYYNFRITYLHYCIMLRNHDKDLAGIANFHMNDILHCLEFCQQSVVTGKKTFWFQFEK